MTFQTPILFLIFNRPKETQKVFEQIKKIKPRKLFVAADGPRSDIINEEAICKATRNIIVNNIDWECDLKILFRDENLGCGYAISQAITWFFEQAEEGIIIEDDVFPDESFFSFCEQLLIKYREEEKIMCIGGVNFIDSYKAQSSYLFSNYSGIWGWATWRRAWKNYDFDIKDWNNEKTKRTFRKELGNERFNFFKSLFDPMNSETRLDTWDYQWWFHKLKNKGYGIIPSKNLVENIGFGENATHTSAEQGIQLSMRINKVNFPLSHPKNIEIDESYDKLLVKKYYSGSPKPTLIKRIINKFLKIIKV